jgi:hypothetical protein
LKTRGINGNDSSQRHPEGANVLLGCPRSSEAENYPSARFAISTLRILPRWFLIQYLADGLRQVALAGATRSKK